MPLVHIIAKNTMTSVSIRELFAVFYFHREIHTALDSELHVSYRYYCFTFVVIIYNPYHNSSWNPGNFPCYCGFLELILIKFPRSKQALKIVIFL